MNTIKNQIVVGAVLLIISISFLSCTLTFPPVSPEPPRLEAKTKMTESLKKLPEPKEKIVATVYKFRDQTGQYKNSETGTNWSTAVTQGATSILIKALEESNWFIVIEREGLSNLLNERKIIRSSRANFQSDSSPNMDAQLLPPLLFAGVILEGGIISYDSNIMTGGIGLKYFGAGGSTQYREDRISIYLRAISTQSGRVLLNVNTSKTVLSQMVDVGFFRYVEFKKLLEAETGYSFNEPTEICVREAIEKAVESLVIEGVLKNIWQLSDSTGLSHQSIQNYLHEKDENELVDVYNRSLASNKGIGIGLNYGIQLYSGDYAKGEYNSSGKLNIRIPTSESFSIGLGVGTGAISDGYYFTADNYDLEFLLNYNFLPANKLNPYCAVGLGLTSAVTEVTSSKADETSAKFHSQAVFGLGLEAMLMDNFGLDLMIDNHYFLDDKIDNVDHGNYNDFYWGGRIGFYYFF